MVTYVKISDLPIATEATGDSELEVNQAGITRRITVDQIADVIAATLPPPDMSDYATDEEVADAIALIPDPAWAEITGKPATFPPATHIHPESDVTNLVADLALKAPLASPTFTGDPTAPTPATADNDTSIATTAFTRAAIASFAPAPDLSAYAPLASPVFTGNPTAPTPTAGDNDTSIATTAYVTAALAAGASISVGITPPVSPSANQLWWNTDSAVGGGAMYIYYDSFWVPASPGVGSGAVVQTVSYQTGAVATGTTLIPSDDTIPQITEGTEFLTVAITPRSATSKLIINVNISLVNSAAGVTDLIAALFQDSGANALAAKVVAAGQAYVSPLDFTHTMVSGTTSATTFRVRAGSGTAGTITVNGYNGTRRMGGVMASSIVIQEVL